jgi:signal transduction histidine kinase
MKGRGNPVSVGEPAATATDELTRELVAHFRAKKDRLRRQWVEQMTAKGLLTGLTPKETETESITIYDTCVGCLEKGEYDAAQTYATRMAERGVLRGMSAEQIIGGILTLRDVYGRSLFERYPRDMARLSGALDIYEPVANKILSIVALAFIEEREKVVREEREKLVRQQQEAIRELSTPVLSEEAKRIADLGETLLAQALVPFEMVYRGFAEANSKLRESNETLERRVRERTAELEEANQELQREISERERAEQQLLQAQKMEAIGRLAGGVAHDFNNLLTIISGYSAPLLEQMDGKAPLRGHVEQIATAADRAAMLTRQLLAFGRRQVLAPQILDLNTVVANMEKMLRRLIGEDIDLATLQDPQLGRVKADPGQIEQVILNLAVNARDAIPRGGKLTLETANVDLDNSYAREHVAVTPGPYVMLAVSDNGVGMDPPTLARIFEPFFTTKEVGKGTGLGLATVYGIVKQSGGNVYVYSEPRRGATFKIYLPRVEETFAGVEPNRHAAAPTTGTETVLLVEDEDTVRFLIRNILESKGYRVLEARRGTEALSLCERHTGPLHLLLTDLVMPEMDGRELAEQLGPRYPAMKVLYISGYTNGALVHHGMLPGDTAYLQKPFTPDTLAQKVREVLGG